MLNNVLARVRKKSTTGTQDNQANTPSNPVEITPSRSRTSLDEHLLMPPSLSRRPSGTLKESSASTSPLAPRRMDSFLSISSQAGSTSSNISYVLDDIR
jgi:hypothetical protein